MTATKKKRADIIDNEKPNKNNLNEYLCLDQYPDWLWKRLEWFQDQKFGLFMHWGIYSQWGCIESWPLVKEDTWGRPDNLQAWTDRNKDYDLFVRDYRNLNTTFNPQNFHPEKWAEYANEAGMKYMAFTTKHHDGFCMFDTATTDYRITHSTCPFHTDPRANIAKEVFDAFKKKDFGIACYFSKSDWHCPWYWAPQFGEAPNRHPNYNTHEHPEVWAHFADFVYRQIEELMSNYGQIDVLWLDGGQVKPPDQDINMAEIAKMARKHQPGLIMADRTVGGLYENILTPEQRVPDKPLGHAWESCMTMGKGWAYNANDIYKPTQDLIHMLVDVVSRGGNLLLNVGPDPNGEFAPDAIKRLQEIGEWMKINGEAIYETRPVAPYYENNTVFTQKGKFVYAIVKTSSENTFGIDSVSISSFKLKPDTKVEILGCNTPLEVKETEENFTIKLPPGSPTKHAFTLKFEV